eukprot:3478776-Prymnesium_polylepis.2
MPLEFEKSMCAGADRLLAKPALLIAALRVGVRGWVDCTPGGSVLSSDITAGRRARAARASRALSRPVSLAPHRGALCAGRDERSAVRSEHGGREATPHHTRLSSVALNELPHERAIRRLSPANMMLPAECAPDPLPFRSSCPPSDWLWRPAEYSTDLLRRVVALNGARRPATGLDACANLAPAHTGTSSLQSVLNAATHGSGRRQLAHDHHGFVHHLHSKTVHELHRSGARCFVLTLRDPVARLSSLFSFQSKHRNWGNDLHALSKSRQTRSPSELIGAMRKPSHRAHDVTRALYNGSLAGNKRWRNAKVDALQSGSCGLIPQVDYLLGLDEYSDIELHVVCTHRFGDDWRRVRERFDDIDSANKTASSGRTPRALPHLNENPRDRAWLQMSRDEEAYVRHCMYPEDTWLTRRLCGVACDHDTSASARGATVREVAAALEVRGEL